MQPRCPTGVNKDWWWWWWFWKYNFKPLLSSHPQGKLSEVASQGRFRFLLLRIVAAHANSGHVMHWAYALRNTCKIKNDREDGHCYVQLCLDLMTLDVRWPLLFFPETDLNYNYKSIYTLSKMNKNSMWEFKKIQDFCPQDIESCHLVTARCMKLLSLESNLFSKEPQ